jgi:hypothetical protein
VLTDRCVCGNRLFFGNTHCLDCGRALGFLPQARQVTPLETTDGTLRALTIPGQPAVRRCANHQAADCNWLIHHDDPRALCLACRLTQVIPDLGPPAHALYWQRLESAKRYLLCDLLRLGLPIIDRHTDPEGGLGIDFMADQHTPEGVETIVTGHLRGRITVNIAEADDVHREAQRVRLGERNRTLLGHLRHESGHYYWMHLIESDPQRLAAFRACFGDERHDYRAAMTDYYNAGPRPEWARAHISAYASAHPWEDWAESWAHYLHITDAMETARDFGLIPPRDDERFAADLQRWGELSQALNALSRSVGAGDPYPFAIVETVAGKLAFIHSLMPRTGGSGRVSSTWPSPAPQASRSDSQ